MFLKKTQNKNPDGTYSTYYTLVRSVRVDGVPKHQTLLYLGALSDAEAQGIQNAISAPKNPNISFVDTTTFSASAHYQFLALWLLHWVYKYWGLHQALSGISYAQLMVLNRAVDPSSKIGVFDWAPKTACPAFLGIPLSSEPDYEIYRDLDRITKKQDEIMKYIYLDLKRRNLLTDNTFVYDITATYMEGTKCLIADYGHSAGGEQGHKQIKIALAITRDGYPFYWQVLKGNTSDKTTVKTLTKRLNELFDIDKCTFVFDRGMVSEGNFNVIESAGCNYLSALSSSTLRAEHFPDLAELARISDKDCAKLIDELAGEEAVQSIPVELSSFTLYHDGDAFYRTYKRNGRRYIVIFNPQLCLTRRIDRNKRLEKAKAEIKEINVDLIDANKSRKREPLEAKVKSIISNLELKAVCEPIIDEVIISRTSDDGKELKPIKTFRVSLKLNKDNIQAADAYDGLYCLCTDIPEQKLSDEQAIEMYRKKAIIEDVFRTVKSDIKLRPLRVRVETRVQGHVTVCVLAYLLRNTLEQRIKGSGLKYKTAESIIKKLSECTIDEYHFSNITESVRTMTKITESQLEILKAIGAQDIILPSVVAPILKSKNYINADPPAKEV